MSVIVNTVCYCDVLAAIHQDKKGLIVFLGKESEGEQSLNILG